MATYQTAGFPAHHQYFPYDYRSSQQTPPRADAYNYYSSRQHSYATPPRTHARRPTVDATFSYSKTTYPSPRQAAYHSTPDYSSAKYYNTSAKSTPQRKSEYVSGSARRSRESAYYDAKPQRRYSSAQQYSTRTRQQYVYNDDCSSGESSEYLPRYEQYEARPPPYKPSHHQQQQKQQRQRQHHPSQPQPQPYYYESRTDRRYYDQVPVYTRAEPTNESSGTRPRRASYTTYGAKPAYTSSTPRRPSTATKPPPKATAEDARQAGIPAGFCYKNWDPTEEPILLLGSVFDANSLGKWIYDWTVFFFGPATPMTDVAGDLWLLLIQLAGKVKRAEECLGRIRRTASRELVDDFLESGERLWQRFNKLLKTCEAYMWKAARKENGGRSGGGDGKVRMGKNSGCEFVDAIFGRDRELEHTEQLMTGMRLWSMRFDANCENILRDPSA